MSDPVDNIKEYWAESKMALTDMTKEDAEDLLKIMILQSVDGNWGDGFVNLTRLELLAKVFPEDGLIQEVYRQLYEKCNTFMTTIDDKNYSAYPEMIFRDQPTTYKHHGDGVYTWYDVNDDHILKKLMIKYHMIAGAIQNVVYR